mgnify:CR=1 FL=1
MDFSFWIILWIIFLVIQNVADKKKSKKLPPPDSTSSQDFEIPTLANDPNFPGEENQIVIQDSTQSAEVRDVDLFDIYQRKKISMQDISESEKISEPIKKFEQVEEKKLPLGITPDSAMNAIIMSEILSKPKALRKK